MAEQRPWTELSREEIASMADGPQPEEQREPESATFICSRETLDGIYPSLILGINARRLGMDATIFYTFMGINVIKKGRSRKSQVHSPGSYGRHTRNVQFRHLDDEEKD